MSKVYPREDVTSDGEKIGDVGLDRVDGVGIVWTWTHKSGATGWHHDRPNAILAVRDHVDVPAAKPKKAKA